MRRTCVFSSQPRSSRTPFGSKDSSGARNNSRRRSLYLLVSLPIKLYVVWWVGIYRRLWRYAGIIEVERLISSAAISGLACLVLGGLVLPILGITAVRVPLSVLFMDGLLTAAFAALPRLGVRAFGRRKQRRRLEKARRALIVGAGAAGEMIVKELLGHPQLGLNPVGFIDDDRVEARPPAVRPAGPGTHRRARADRARRRRSTRW